MPQTTDDFDLVQCEEFYYDEEGRAHAGEDPSIPIYSSRTATTGATLVTVPDEFSDTGTTEIWKGGVRTLTIQRRGKDGITINLTDRMARLLDHASDDQPLLKLWYREAWDARKALEEKAPARAKLSKTGRAQVAAFRQRLQGVRA